jgi:predicted metalloprotease with PDZ domain
MFRVRRGLGLVACLPVYVLLVAAVASHADGSEPAPGMLGVTLDDWAGRVLVKDVYVGGPAYVAGLRPGDRIIAVGHKAVNTSAELIEVLAEYGANERVELYASRDGWMKDLPVTLAKRADVVGKPLLNATATPQPRTTSVPVQPSRPLVHPDPFHRKRYERW